MPMSKGTEQAASGQITPTACTDKTMGFDRDGLRWPIPQIQGVQLPMGNNM
jgi:hypothetical protein